MHITWNLNDRMEYDSKHFRSIVSLLSLNENPDGQIPANGNRREGENMCSKVMFIGIEKDVKGYQARLRMFFCRKCISNHRLYR